MKKRLFVLGLGIALACGLMAGPERYRNLFSERLGIPEAELSAKIDTVWRQLFYGDDESERIYYPVGKDMAYIADIASRDVRSEGMSYGMMIAVQLDKQEEFDRLWKWANIYMRHHSGPRKGYFAWHCDYEGNKLSPSSASDGEEWFAMALYFAAGRWGNGEGIFDYQSEADRLLHLMLHKKDPDPQGEITSIFNRKHHQVVFVPVGKSATFTDPSYHLPAFYELWASWASKDQEFWKKCATVSREFFRKAAHPETGLMPDYAHFDGSPRKGDRHEDFRYDAWRTLANVGLDWSWYARDPWQKEQSNRVLRFLLSFGEECPDQFTLDGRPLSEESSLGLYAMAAVAGLAAEPELADPFLNRVWHADIPSGHWRYYNGLIYFLGLLQAGGEFRIYAPPGE